MKVIPSASIISGILLCLTGLGILAYVSYDNYTGSESVKNLDLVSSTTYTAMPDGNTGLSSVPMGITVTEYLSNSIDPSSRVIFEAMWIPLLILGSYILVHSDYAIITGGRQ